MKPNKAPQGISKIDVDVGKLPMHTCPSCHSSSFIGGIEIRLLSMIQSPSGKNETIKVSIAVCSVCGKKVMNKDIEKSTSNLFKMTGDIDEAGEPSKPDREG